jgi:hypothetical protein
MVTFYDILGYFTGLTHTHTQECIQKFPDWVDNEIYAWNNKHSLRSNTKGYGGKTPKTDSQNSDTTAPSGRELYNLQFSLQTASPEAFGYTIVLQTETRELNYAHFKSSE